MQNKHFHIKVEIRCFFVLTFGEQRNWSKKVKLVGFYFFVQLLHSLLPTANRYGAKTHTLADLLPPHFPLISCPKF